MADADIDYLRALFGLKGRVALVTGARHGFGRALAVSLARAGADVAVAGRDAGALEPLVAELRALGADALALPIELTEPDSVERAVERAATWAKRLDVLVNCAGLSIRRPASDYALEEWDAVVNTNLRGAFLAARAAAARMRDGGRIVNLSSTFATVAVAERAPYAASKAGLEQLTRALAVEWAARGITVNAIAPGATLTPTRQELLGDPDVARTRVARIPLGRLGTPQDVIGAALLLISDAGTFMTGQTLVVDGGYTLGSGG